MRVARTQASLRIWADSPDPSLLADAISTEISCTGLQYIHVCVLHVQNIQIKYVETLHGSFGSFLWSQLTNMYISQRDVFLL